jgi:carbon storage regulator
MLVLTRKRGETIRIAETVEVRVLEIRKGQIKLGISGPPEMPIHRDKLYRRLINYDTESRHAHTHIEESPSDCEGEGAARCTNFDTPPALPRVVRSSGDGRCVSCKVDNGLPMVHGKARGYYVSHRGGRRTLVVVRGRGERIRINGTTEIVILEIHADQVNIAIKSLPDVTTRSHG